MMEPETGMSSGMRVPVNPVIGQCGQEEAYTELGLQMTDSFRQGCSGSRFLLSAFAPQRPFHSQHHPTSLAKVLQSNPMER